MAQCDDADDICGCTTAATEAIMHELADSWPAGSVVEVPAAHEIYVDDHDAILEVIDGMLSAT